MDDRTDRAHYAIEKKFGPLPSEQSVWDKIEDDHYPECPTAQQARKKIKSTFCLCDKIAEAHADLRAEECMRCQNLVKDCRCGAGALRPSEGQVTAKDLIVNRLAASDRPLAIHELGLMSVSQTSASARLRELARDGIVQSVRVPGKRYTAWTLTPKDLVLPLNSQPGVI